MLLGLLQAIHDRLRRISNYTSVGIWPICECVIARSDSTSEMEDSASERQTCRQRRTKKHEVEIGDACRCLGSARLSLD